MDRRGQKAEKGWRVKGTGARVVRLGTRCPLASPAAFDRFRPVSKSTKTRPPNVFLVLGKAPWIRRLTKLHTVHGLQTASMDGHCIASLSTRTSCACDAGSKGCDCVLQVSSMVFFSSSYPGTLSRGSVRQAASARTHTQTHTCSGIPAGGPGRPQPARRCCLFGGRTGQNKKKTGGGNRDSWGPRRRDGQPHCKVPVPACQSRCRFSLSVTLLLAWSLAWPVPAPHGDSVFSTVSPHARPRPDCPTDFAGVSLTASNALIFISSKGPVSSYFLLRPLPLVPALLPSCSSRRVDGTSDQCDRALGLQVPARAEGTPTLRAAHCVNRRPEAPATFPRTWVLEPGFSNLESGEGGSSSLGLCDVP